ncbi:MAG: hypothetical protein ACLT1J_00065 [Mediterraneibacter gnavus]|uniref:hypothetical protein n=1 Tax=Mediterraneibacter gnavus TaxID=33038 RepID=UPI001D038281|nr:hypothetical protein [Mediterraneibacter gnavus]MCB5653068.1 hypothetical protein [Mediterraneibacter gnavus]
MGKNILQHLFSGYLKLLKKTVAIEWQEIQFVTGNQVFGFWHEDSFLMNLVLEELSGKTSPVDVIVTADTRGDYIEHMLQACGGHALRVPDGFAAFGALKKFYRILMSRRVPLRWRWTDRWDQGMSRKNWHFIWQSRRRNPLWEFQFLIMDVFGCSGDGTTMRFHFRFRKSSSQFTIMEKSIKNKFLTFRQEQKSQNVVYC